MPRTGMTNGLNQAIAKAGSRNRLARLLGVSQQAVAQWTKVPTHQILNIERIVGIPREDLRPDLYRKKPKGMAP